MFDANIQQNACAKLVLLLQQNPPCIVVHVESETQTSQRDIILLLSTRANNLIRLIDDTTAFASG